MISNYMIEELNYGVHNVSIPHDDERIEAHKIWLRKQSKCGFWYSAAGSGNLLHGHAICERNNIYAMQFLVIVLEWNSC